MIAPTIIIGLGGIGSDICCRVSKQVKDSEQRKRIRFVCIDTDINDLSRRREEDPRIITIQTSAPYMVGNYLDTNTNAKDNWFPVHNILMGKTPTEGAGQVRSISRLAFEEAVREGRMSALDKAIEELYFLDGATEPQAVRIMIVSTLAGGTGSGIVLPVALYVRHFLETRFRKSASVVRGFFLLPEIMFGNKSPEECGSLCCNAYASMRELDAFMRRGDGALSGPKYRNLKLELPDPSSGFYVDYQVSPFNFCFLYDKRNTDDLQLKSFDDYKEHAANTIYAQAISGISNRSNSNEDNVIKPLIKSNGRNRFCGAGSSLLKYPRENVLRYIAGKWCVQNMDEEWLSIDKAYIRYLADQKILRKKNPSLKDVTLADFYLDRVEHSEKGSFEERIYMMCHDESESVTGELEYTSKVDKYTEALRRFVRDQLANDPELAGIQSTYTAAYSRIEGAMSHEKTDGEEDKIKSNEFKDEFESLVGIGLSYVNTAKQIGNRLGRTLAMQLFQDEKDHTSDNAIHRMEYYMRDDEHKFIHPNASRYFIYALTKNFNEGVIGAADHIGEYTRLVDPFDDASTPEKETGFDFIEKKIGKKILVVPTDHKARKDLMAKLKKQHDSAFDFAMELTLKSIYEAGITYLRAMSGAFEVFYTNFSSYLKDTRNEVAEIERKYVNGEGKATRYVCASEKCLGEMLRQMPCAGESSNVNGDLSASIFQEMKTFAMMVRKPNPSIYFASLYEDKIMGFWSKSVEDNHATLINMDIIDALEAEAEYEKEETLTEDQKARYAAQILKQAERLAAPFIEEPMGEIRHPFTICAYNPTVMGAPDSTRRSFVKQNLNDSMGGQPDENVSPYELMIYKAVYNLSAGDLMRFRAPEGKDTRGGEYYAAYIETIRQLGPDTNTNAVLTPHLDKHWHLPKYLPDLDDRNQAILETEIYTALAWGMLTGKIEQNLARGEYSSADSSLNITYRPATKKSDDFVVPNGTPCDDLYEVIDALAINPPQVSMILNDFHKTMDRERMDGLLLSQSRLMNSLHWLDPKTAFGDDYEEDFTENQIAIPFAIRQFVPDQKASIFDLIYWSKRSMPADDFAEEELSIMLDSMLTMIEDYVGQFTGTHRKYDRCYAILVDQFKQFLENLTDPQVKRPRNRLYDNCVCMIRDQLDDRIENVYKMDSRRCDVMRVLYQKTVDKQEVVTQL